jgi:tetratricopeptide (TPR) repeat protein
VRVRALAAAVLCVVAAAAPARAQGDDFAAAEARRHFARGSAYFKLGDFDQALAEFRAAYSLNQAPGLWFNMAQAARSARRYQLATFYFRTYLRAVPDAPERAYVEERLRDMALLTAAEPPAAAPDPAAPAPAPPARGEDGGRTLRYAGIGALGVGVALAATAIVFAKKSSDAGEEITRAFAEHGTFDARLAALYADGRRDQRIAIGTGIGAAALAIGGTILYVVGSRAADRVAVVPARGGVGVAWSF